MTVYIQKLDPRAQAPERATAGSAGADLHALLDEVLTIPPGGRAAVPTGIAIGLPSPETVGLVFARSGLATKRGLAPANKVGVIDPDYRGEFFVPLRNESAVPQAIEPGERIAQMILTPFLTAQFVEAETLSATVRGEGGFGSTGTK